MASYFYFSFSSQTVRCHCYQALGTAKLQQECGKVNDVGYQINNLDNLGLLEDEMKSPLCSTTGITKKKKKKKKIKNIFSATYAETACKRICMKINSNLKTKDTNPYF